MDTKAKENINQLIKEKKIKIEKGYPKATGKIRVSAETKKDLDEMMRFFEVKTHDRLITKLVRFFKDILESVEMIKL